MYRYNCSISLQNPYIFTLPMRRPQFLRMISCALCEMLGHQFHGILHHSPFRCQFWEISPIFWTQNGICHDMFFPQIKISSQVTALHWRTCGTTLRPLWPAQHRLDCFFSLPLLDNLNPGKSRKFRYPKELPWGYSSFSVAPKMQTMEMFCWRKPVSFFADHRNNWPFAGTFGARMLCIEECHTTASLAIDGFNQIVLKSHHHHLKQVWTYLSNLYILLKKYCVKR